MPRKLKQMFTALICFVGSACTPMPHKSQQAAAPQADSSKLRWAVYYAKELPAESFKDYDVVVFDRVYYPDFKKIQPHSTVLAYVTIGEVRGDTDEYKLMEAQKALISPRSKWDTYTVDIISKTWAKLVMAQVEDAMDKGFDGVMLDTVDSALHLADMDSPERGLAAQEGAIALIKEMHQRFPGMKIMLNRGFEVLPRVAPAIDFILAESTLAETDVSTGQSKVFPATTYQSLVDRLNQARAINPKIQIFALDYWNQDDAEGIRQLYAIHRAHGFVPYVTTPDLRRHTPEPAGKFEPKPRQKIA